MFSIRQIIILIALTCTAPLAALAQRVYWDPPGGRLGLGKVEEISLVFEDCSPVDSMELPDVAGLAFSDPSRSQQTSIVNFQMSTRVVLTYPVRAREKGDVLIPAFDAATNKGKIAVGEVRFVVGDAGVGPTGISIADVVSSQLKPARTALWAGEVVDFEYLLVASNRYNISLGSEPEWKPVNLLIEPLGQGERVETNVGNERRQAVRYRTRGLFPVAGQYSPEPVRQIVNVQTGERAGMFFSQPRIEQFTVESSTSAITVRPLPVPAPEGFHGAVGALSLQSTVVPQSARVGEPITWTLKLTGSGNWTAGLALPEREVSSDFQVVQPKSRIEMEEGRLFQGTLTEDAVLVPTRAGTYTLGPVVFSTFDPASGKYRTQRIPEVTVTIDPVPAAATSGTQQPVSGPASPGTPGIEASQTGAASTAAPLPPLPGDITPPRGLPGMPLTVGLEGAVPRRLPLFWLIAAPLVSPLVLWTLLAVTQALKVDPARDRKRALRDLRHLMRELSQRKERPDTPTLERWRTATARLWNVRRATPTRADLAAALTLARGVPRPDEWLALWTEAEASMFSATATLPADWVDRANACASSARIRSGIPWMPVRAAHWAPRLTVAIVALVCGGLQGDLRANGPLESYNDGRFAEAREAWLRQLEANPGDWAAHNNVALASAQLDAWAAASAHATAAFLLHPRDKSVQHHLRLAVTHLDSIDPSVRRVIDGAWYDHPLRWMSPGDWQSLLIGGAVAFGLALIALVISLHAPRGRIAVRTTGQAMGVVGLLVVAASALALWRYGPLAHPRAAMVLEAAQLLSIPSDIADKQKTVTIAPGSVVTIERSFLGWDRVTVRGDAAGWIRHEQLLPFYQASRRKAGIEAAAKK